MTDIKQKKEDVKMHLKDLRQKLKKMHLSVTEELRFKLIFSSEFNMLSSLLTDVLQEVKNIKTKKI